MERNTRREVVMKKILFAASECVPFVKTGGLADVVGSLPQAFDKSEYDIRVIIPNYHAIKPEYREKMECIYYFQMDNRIYVGVHRLEMNGITYYFIDNEQYFSGVVPYYDLYQDLERFAYFSKAVLSALPLIGFRPDIIHCHDWQTSLIPVYLNTVFQGDPFFRGIRTVFTIHNIRFKGEWDVGHIRWVSALPDEVFEPGLLVSPYQDRSIPKSDWNCTMMRGALVYSDYITTVSNSYAWEIQTPQFGEGLDDILKWRHERLWGIINGIDYKAREEIIELIIRAADESKTFVISTHLLEEIESFIEYAVFIREGRLVDKVNLESERMKTGRSLTDIYVDIM